jgi:hypothetical protein
MCGCQERGKPNGGPPHDKRTRLEEEPHAARTARRRPPLLPNATSMGVQRSPSRLRPRLGMERGPISSGPRSAYQCHGPRKHPSGLQGRPISSGCRFFQNCPVGRSEEAKTPKTKDILHRSCPTNGPARTLHTGFVVSSISKKDQEQPPARSNPGGRQQYYSKTGPPRTSPRDWQCIPMGHHPDGLSQTRQKL